MNTQHAPQRSAAQWPVVRWSAAVVAVAILAGGWFAFDRYQRDAPRRQALGAIRDLHAALDSREPAALLDRTQLPPAIAGKPAAEQATWLQQMLADELSAPGLDALARGARFGPLLEVFPDEARRWAESARVPVEECVAFRMERDGLRAEVVLHRTPAGYRIVRCNNVKQMAPPAFTKS